MRVMFRVKTSLLLLVTGLFSTVGGLSAKPPQPALGTPVGLKTTAGNSWVSFTWSPSAGATSYHLKRATKSGGPYVQIAAPVSTFHTDSGLAVGTTYFYVISAVNSAGESANSTEVSVKPAASTAAQVPSTPIGLTATPGNSWVSLTWSEVPGAASYRLKRATGTGGPYVQIAAPVSTGHTDSGLENGRTYFYVVSAEGTVGESSNSAQVGATPSGEAALSSSTARLATAAGTLGLPATFFGQTITWVSASHFPSVPFGSFRLWDTQTTWAEIETSRNTFTWSELDAWLAVAAGEDKDVLYTFGRTPQWISMRPSESCTHGNIGCAAPPSDVDSGDASFKAFVTAVVKHSLASSTGHIKYYRGLERTERLAVLVGNSRAVGDHGHGCLCDYPLARSQRLGRRTASHRIEYRFMVGELLRGRRSTCPRHRCSALLHHRRSCPCRSSGRPALDDEQQRHRR